MAWTTPRTWVPGELVTASIMNTHVRDNMNVLKTSISNDGAFWLGGVTTVLSGSTAGSVDNWTPGINGNMTFIMSSATDLIVSGIAGGYAGLTLTFINNGSGGNLYFKPASLLSLPANRLINTALVGDTPVAAGGWITYVHNGLNWRLMNHEQGAWITPTFLNTNYVAIAPMSWTVTAPQVTSGRYKLSGNTLFFQFNIDGSTLGGSASNEIRILNGAWGGYAANGQSNNPISVASDGGGAVTIPTEGQLNTGSTFHRLLKVNVANWVVGAFSVYFSGMCSVQ